MVSGDGPGANGRRAAASRPRLGARGVLALALGLALNLTAGLVRAAAAEPPASAAPAVAPPDWPGAVAQYRVTLRPARGPAPPSRTWTLWRDAQRIALVKPGEDEVWLRDPTGIRLERVFHADRTVVEYSAGELRTLQVDARWRALGTLFDEDLLASLRRTGAVQGQAHAVSYAGRIAGDQVQLQWDERWRLPVRLQRRNAAGSVLFERLTVHDRAPAAWARPAAGSDDYQRLDAADFGDMEDNPVVRKAQAGDRLRGWGGVHGH